MLQGVTTAEKAYRHLYSIFQNHYGVSALMGSIHDISGVDPTSVDATCKKKLKDMGSPYCTDASYTDAVDTGLITKDEFLRPILRNHYGYGLMMWSDEVSKGALYDRAKSKKVSIGDLTLQLQFLVDEIEDDYKQVCSILQKARNVKVASDAIISKYEGNVSASETLKTKRATFAQMYYNMFASKIAKVPSSSVEGSTNSSKEDEGYEVNDKVIVSGMIYGNGKGTGLAIEKYEALMYVVGLAKSDRYPYCIAVANTKGGPRVGWASPESVRRIGTSLVRPSKEVIATVEPESKLLKLRGDYHTGKRVYMRNDAGSHNQHMAILPQGQLVVSTEGRYTLYEGQKWLYVETVYKKTRYVGFIQESYLNKVG